MTKETDNDRMDRWANYLARNEGRFRPLLESAEMPEPVLLIMDAREPGRGQRAALRLLRRKNPEGLTDAELCERNRKIFVNRTDARTAAFSIGADLFVRADQDQEADGKLAWLAIVDDVGAAIARVQLRRGRSYLDGAKFAAKADKRTPDENASN